MTGERTVRLATPADLTALISIETEAFGAARWGAAGVRNAVAAPGVFALISEPDGIAAGLFIGRVAADEAEVLTMGVLQNFRRRGVAKGLLTSGREYAARSGANVLHLEVAADNIAAIALYESFGFIANGLRPAYYRNGADAVLMRAPVENVDLPSTRGA